MNILLIDPSVGNGDGLNTGLGWLAASTEAAGHGARVLDFVNRPPPPGGDRALLRETVERLRPDAAGFCVHSITLGKTAELAADLREYFRGPLLIGGPQMAFEKKDIFLKIPQTDFGVIGEAEETLPELLSALDAGVSDFSGTPGLVWKKDGAPVENAPREPKRDISGLPFPNYRRHFGLESVSAPYPVMTSRGCPFSCVFCNSHMSGKKWRLRRLEDVMDELSAAVREYGVREFMVQEPVFNLKPEHVIEFCEMLHQRNIHLPWFSPSGLRADRVTPEMLAAMKKAGCSEVKIGVETLVPELFPAVNKGTSLEKLTGACRIIKQSGFPLRGSFIIGLPGDNYERSMENYRLAREAGFDGMDWSLLVPYPGTKAYDWVKENGRLFHDYCEADQIASQASGTDGVKLAFDTPDYPAALRLKAFVKISVKCGNYFFDRNSSALRKIFDISSQILKNDPARPLWHLRVIMEKLSKQRERGKSKDLRYRFGALAPF
jgi:radical SAM superfamily enzyme YgiQ (UPF0313 family)